MTTAAVRFSGGDFGVAPNGWTWERRGEVTRGTWADVASVMTFRAAVQNFGEWQHLGVTFNDGRSFRFHSQDRAAFVVAELTVRYAGPLIVERVLRALEAGETVRFGALSMTRERLIRGRKSWPLTAITGHRAYQGSWMMDVGPKEKPSLALMVQINKLENFFAFRAALERYAPGRDYGDGAPDLGSWIRPSASSHDPRYPAGRTRVMILGGLLGAGLLVALGALAQYHWQSSQHEDARRASDARFAELARIAEESPVEGGTPYRCDAEVGTMFNIAFSYRAPAGSPHPRVSDRDAAFTSSGSPVGPYWDEKWFLHAEERALTKADKSGKRTVTLAVALVDAKKKKVRCEGEVRARVRDDAVYSAGTSLARLLEAVTCGFDASECKTSAVPFELLPLDEDAPAEPETTIKKKKPGR